MFFLLALMINDLRCFKEKFGLLRQTKGQQHKAPLTNENVARTNTKRCLILTEDMAANTSLEECHLICKRLGAGISPIHWEHHWHTLTKGARR